MYEDNTVYCTLYRKYMILASLAGHIPVGWNHGGYFICWLSFPSEYVCSNPYLKMNCFSEEKPPIPDVITLPHLGFSKENIKKIRDTMLYARFFVDSLPLSSRLAILIRADSFLNEYINTLVSEKPYLLILGRIKLLILYLFPHYFKSHSENPYRRVVLNFYYSATQSIIWIFSIALLVGTFLAIKIAFSFPCSPYNLFLVFCVLYAWCHVLPHSIFNYYELRYFWPVYYITAIVLILLGHKIAEVLGK